MFKKFKYWIFLFTSPSLFGLTTLHVTLSSDNDPGGMGNPGDLRHALNVMNQGLNAVSDDYAIVFNFPMTITLNGILPIINNSSNPVSITIGNSGSTPTVTIDGNSGAYSGFFIPIGNVTIQNMIFQNLTAQGGAGGDGISGGGGGMGAGGAIYAPESFLNGSNPSIILMNVSINDCSAVGGSGGSYLVSSSGSEGGGGGGGFSGNGGSITTTGMTGGGGGGGFGGNGGDATLAFDGMIGGGGGGGGGLGSRATMGMPTNLGTGGSDQGVGSDGSGYGLTTAAGSGAGGNSGGNTAGGGGGGGTGGGGGGSAGFNGMQPQGTTPPGGGVMASGGNGGDGGGGGGGGVVMENTTNEVDGKAGSGGYGGGGGGGAGTGAYDMNYTVEGGSGGIGGGGGGGGVNQSGMTPADGGSSTGGGGGGGGPSNGSTSSGGMDTGNLGGGSGGAGSNSGGGGGGGGSGLGAAIFVDSNLNFTIQAFSGIPTTFNTSNNTTQAGTPGSAGTGGGSDGSAGSALGNSIFLRSQSSLTFMANDVNDLLTLGDQVAFVDDTSFGGMGTNVFVTGNGTVVYNGTTDYQGTITINNANFEVNGQIDTASISVCRNINLSSQRGTLSGSGILTGDVLVNSGTISPSTNETLTLGNLSLNSADPINNTLGSLVYIEIDSSGTSLVSVTGSASLAGTLEIDLDPSAQPGTYTILTSSGITGTFDSITFAGATPNYSLSYLPLDNPTFVQFDFLGYPSSNILTSPSNLQGQQKKNNFGFEYELYNQLTWTLSPSSEIAGYFIYRDGNEIAMVNALTSIYNDHNRLRGIAYVYSLVAFDGNGNTSSPITITVP